MKPMLYIKYFSFTDRCNNNICIMETQVCDQVSHCEDKSDEAPELCKYHLFFLCLSRRNRMKKLHCKI